MPSNNNLEKAVNLGQLQIAYEAGNQRITELEQALPTVKNTADSALQPTTTYSANGQQYTADELLQAIAELMNNTIVTQ